MIECDIEHISRELSEFFLIEFSPGFNVSMKKSQFLIRSMN